jgi:hypothetical protein
MVAAAVLELLAWAVDICADYGLHSILIAYKEMFIEVNLPLEGRGAKHSF